MSSFYPYGISADYHYQEFSLDSYDNSGPANINYTALNWPKFNLGGKVPIQNVVALKIISAEIPFSYYIFNSSNNTFTFSENGGTYNLVTIPIGNYTSSQMITELGTLLTAASTVGTTYVVTLNSNTEKLTISGTGGTMTSFSFTFGTSTGTGNTSPRLYLGFPGGITNSSGTSLITPNSINLSGPNYLYINSSIIGALCNLNLPYGAVNLGGGNSSVQMAKVQVNTNAFGTILYNDADPQYWFHVGNISTFQTIDLYLTIGNLGSSATVVPIDLNGLNFSIKLGILLKNTTEDSSQSGTYDQGRVTKRSRPI